jgi:hypothetical protein
MTNIGSINLIYAITGNGQLPSKVWKQIEEAQSQYNRRFTWVYENLSLTLQRPEMKFRLNLPLSKFNAPSGVVVSSGHLPYDSGILIPNAIASGQTKVRDNLWNAHLVVRFMRWVSEQLPDYRVELYDEGGFILAGSVVIEKGKISLNRPYLERQRMRILEAYGDPNAVLGLAQAELVGMNGNFFADTIAYDYRETLEIKDLLNNDPELCDESISSIAERSFVLAQEVPTQTMAA